MKEDEDPPFYTMNLLKFLSTKKCAYFFAGKITLYIH